MYITSLRIKNFRSYEDTLIKFNKNLNVIIGKNDAGKSTILEVLDILLNGGTIKIDKNDCNIFSDNKVIEIIATFKFESNDNKLLLDSKILTDIEKEFLLNIDSEMEIKLKVDTSKTKLTLLKYLIVNYPTSLASNPLIYLKNADLKKELKKLEDSGIDVTDVDKTINSEIRKKIYEVNDCENISKSLIEIDLQKDEAKNIWSSLEKSLPIYTIFQSDRDNRDTDNDIQNPLKAAAKNAISEIEDKLEEIKIKIENELTEIGNQTIDKMKEMGLDISNELKPIVNNKKWDTLFTFSLEGDDGIPLNKRGSGFRRLVMLNYFRVEAEKKLSDTQKKSIIYSIEEPETSQHPNHQLMLIDSIKELSLKEKHQIFITTHTPEIAKKVELNQLLLIEKIENKSKSYDDIDKLERITNSLGVLPNIDDNIKVVVFVEGPTDAQFLININKSVKEFNDIIDIENSKEIIIIPTGGSTLQHWVDKRYLERLDLVEIHIYDSDISKDDVKDRNKYKSQIDKVNEIGGLNKGYETKYSEIENYIHPILIKDKYKLDTFFDEENWLEEWVKSDIPKIVNKLCDKSDSDIEPISSKRKIKSTISDELSLNMSKELLEEIEAFEELENWYKQIKLGIES